MLPSAAEHGPDSFTLAWLQSPLRESLSPIQCSINQYFELTTIKQTEKTISHRKSALSIKINYIFNLNAEPRPSVSGCVFARWLKYVCQLELLFFFAAYASMGCLSFWMELGKINWQLLTQKHTHIYKYIYTSVSVHCATTPRCAHTTLKPRPHEHTHVCGNTRASHTLADELSDSLFSGRKWTEG